MRNHLGIAPKFEDFRYPFYFCDCVPLLDCLKAGCRSSFLKCVCPIPVFSSLLECSAKALPCSLDDMSQVLCIARTGISLTFMYISGLGSDLCFMKASDGAPVINSFSCSSCWALCRLRDTSS